MPSACGDGTESCSFKTDDLFALLGRWPLDKDLKEVRTLAARILWGRTFQAEREAGTKTQEQELFLECLRSSRRQSGYSRVNQGVVSGDEIRQGPEGCGPVQILGIIGHERSSGKNGKLLPRFEHRVMSSDLFGLWILSRNWVNGNFYSIRIEFRKIHTYMFYLWKPQIAKNNRNSYSHSKY